ncbi:MAG: hypothetical protein JWN98_238, partial [Abditibacteriota bacterium]|nr:hypothetical protein [Abditibacteriota bacterium]
DAAAISVAAYPQAFNAQKTSIVSFAYRLPATANIALRVRLNDGRAWHIRLKGESNDSLGAIQDIQADNQWHWTSFDLMPFLKRDAKVDPTQIRGLEFVDPMKKTARGFSWEIDDFTLSQAAAGPAKLNWKGLDLAGATKFRIAWDQIPGTAPSEETAETAREFTGAPGTWYFHTQAQDGAGNWGPLAHFPVSIQ